MLANAMQDAAQGAWLTIAEAAALLGTSPDTVRRKIRRGELVAQHRARQVRVHVDGVHGSADGVRSNALQPAVQEHSETLLEALRIIDRLQRENRDLAGLVGSLQQRLVFADERIRMLEAPQNDPSEIASERAADDVSIEPAQTLSPPYDGRPRPWWRFW
jgi:excisionase family DNA binding protein